jgi:hypothetical protein
MTNAVARTLNCSPERVRWLADRGGAALHPHDHRPAVIHDDRGPGIHPKRTKRVAPNSVGRAQ